MVVLIKNDNPKYKNLTNLYVSNDHIRVDGMEYGESIRAEYSHDDELAYSIKSKDYEKLLNAIKKEYPNYQPDETECKSLWGSEWDEFNDLTKEVCMAIKAVFTKDNAYRYIDWFCGDNKIETYNREYDF